MLFCKLAEASRLRLLGKLVPEGEGYLVVARRRSGDDYRVEAKCQ